jgi:NAD+ synthase (glutamine-hydrolysing)
MKITLAQLNFHISNFNSNSQKMIDSIIEARAAGSELVVFSELSVCGYPPYDFLERQEFVEKCMNAIEIIASHCTGIAAIVGGPSINEQPLGKKLYNTAFFLNNGKIEQMCHKSLLPNYDVFDEYRYFQPNRHFQLVEYKGEQIAITICEDLWDNQPVANNFGRGKLYTVSPMEELSILHPTMVVNIAASPFSYTQVDIRKSIITEKAQQYHLPFIYVNQTGANTDLIFDGNSMVVNAQGDIIEQLPAFTEKVVHTDSEKFKYQKPIDAQEISSTQYIHDALVTGIRDYFKKMNFTKATLGLSGGIDSAVVVVLAVEALGAENVRVLLLPSQYSSHHSITDAKDLAENLGIQYDIVPIADIFQQFETALNPLFKGLKPDVTEENLQARIRGSLLMALSNKLGNLLLNTTNKSEAAVGYGTLYGDMNGSIAVLGDVYKTEVYRLARYINRNKEVIPENSITKAPSAELRPGQKDSDSLPEYDVLDAILFRYIEMNLSPAEIIAEGFAEATVNKTVRLVNMNEYKRFQAAPILRISSKAFGTGRRMPLVAKY